MAKKKIKDFKTMKLDALKTELIANRKVLFENNFKHKMGQLKESHSLKEARKNIASCLLYTSPSPRDEL